MAAINVSGNSSEMVQGLRLYLHNAITQLKAQEIILIAVSGGSMISILAEAFNEIADICDAKKLYFAFVDERYVPLSHSDSTFHQYQTVFFSKLPQLHSSNVLHIDPTLPLESCAKNYEDKLRSLLSGRTGNSLVDILFLGLGPVRNSPKPPPERVTMTLDLINSAKHIAFIATGSEKAPIIKAVLENNDVKYPATHVRPKSSDVTWFVDSASASLISKT